MLLSIFSLVESKLVSCQDHPMLSIVFIFCLQIALWAVLLHSFAEVNFFEATKSLQYDLSFVRLLLKRVILYGVLKEIACWCNITRQHLIGLHVRLNLANMELSMHQATLHSFASRSRGCEQFVIFLVHIRYVERLDRSLWPLMLLTWTVNLSLEPREAIDWWINVVVTTFAHFTICSTYVPNRASSRQLLHSNIRDPLQWLACCCECVIIFSNALTAPTLTTTRITLVQTLYVLAWGLALLG